MDGDTQLLGDPRRQAVASVRGYAYQFWHTLYAWINLGPDETLYVEAAEDFDKVGPLGAEAVQVKHSSVSITLRSRPVQEAIGHFWNLRSANPGRDIRYRYLTNATPTLEQGQPFGVGVPGLTLWQQCARTGEKLQELRRFLVNELAHPGIKTFLSNASETDLLAQLVRPIVWDMGQGETSAVESAVTDALVREGRKYGILPSDATHAVPHLLKYVLCLTYSQENRALTHTEFLQQFDEATFVRVPRREYDQLLTGSLPSISPGISPQAATSNAPYEVPPLPPNTVLRSTIIHEIRQRLGEVGILVITGTSGMGKSTLAKLFVQSDQRTPIWTALRESGGAGVAQAMRALAELPCLARESTLLILDDISLDPGETQAFEKELVLLSYIVGQRNGLIVLTSQRGFPGHLTRSLNVDDRAVYEICPLSTAETRTLATQLGCQDLERAGEYAAHCLLQTSGHPQLVQAFLFDAASKHWPELTLDDLSQMAEPVRLERMEIRAALTRVLTSDQLEMVYRLSIVPQKFRRDHAIAIGSLHSFPSGARIQHPGDAFDELVGPWIESLGQEYFNLSPILAGAANQIWSVEILQEARRDIGYVLLSCGRLTQHEAQNVLLIALFTRNIPLLMSVLLGISESTEEKWSYVARDFSWLLYVESRPGKAMFPEDAKANCYFRAFQFRIAAEVEPESAINILNLWESELPEPHSDKESVTLRCIFLIALSARASAPVEIDRVVRAIAELAEIANSGVIPSLNSTTINAQDELADSFEGMERFAVLFGMNLTRCKTAHDLRSLLSSLETIDPAIRNRMFDAFNPPINGASLAINEVWLREAKKEEPNWDQCLRAFESAMECGMRWGSKRLTEVAACASAIIHEEYRRDLDSAVALLDRVTSQIGKSGVLEVQRATALFHHGRNQEALGIWMEWLPQWPIVPGDWIPTPRDSWRKAAIAAANLGRWYEAIACFDEGRKWSSTHGQLDFVIGFLVDAGFASYKGGDIDSALRYFDEGLCQLPPQEQAAGDLKFIQINKCVGHVLMWCAYEKAGYSVEGLSEPTVGLCSSPVRDEKFKDLPYTPHDYIFLHLVVLETRAGKESRFLDKYRNQIVASKFPHVRSQAWETIVYRNLARGELDEFPLTASSWINAVELVRRFSEIGKTPNDSDVQDAELVAIPEEIAAPATLFGAAVLVLIAHGKLEAERLKTWRAQLVKTNLSRATNGFLLFLEGLSSFTESEVLDVLVEDERQLDERLAAALVIAQGESIPADDIFYAHFLLLSAFTQLGRITWPDASAHALESIVRRQWLEAVRTPALLRSPRFTVPEIELACADDQSTGFKKVAKILWAASDAVRISLGSSERDMLRRMTEL